MSAVAILLVLASQRTITEDQIASRYAKWDSSYRTHDVPALAKLLHRQFRIVTGSGKVIDRSTYVKSLWKGAPPESYQTSVLRIECSAGRSIVWTEESSRLTGQSLRLHRYRDTWRLTAGHWLLIESRTLGER